MIIPEGNPVGRPHIQTQNLTAPASQPGKSAAGIPTSGQASIETGSLDNLLSLVVGGSEVQESLVEEIKIKLQAGEYLTKQAAVETADAVLNL